MGHREDLLEGAKRCLLERIRRTTARDIVKESGTNLASIGYHYGSKDALLTQAFVELVQEWGESHPHQEREDAPGGSVERFHSVWARMLRSPSRSPARLGGRRGDRDAGGEGSGAAETDGEGADRRTVRARRDAHGSGRGDAQQHAVQSLGGFYQALLNGLMVQWLFDPASASTADDLTEGLRRVIEGAYGPRD